MKANFKIAKADNVVNKTVDKTSNSTKDLTKEEFEEFIIKSGAKGSFMVYRSNKKDDELGIEQL